MQAGHRLQFLAPALVCMLSLSAAIAQTTAPSSSQQGPPQHPITAFDKVSGPTPTPYEHLQKESWTMASMKDDMQQAAPSAQPSVTAIDVLLEPDATMLQHAAANNARLLAVFPKGFELDAMHRPHVSMIQRFVRTADLDQVFAAVGKVFTSENVTSFKLEAFKYYYIPSGAIGLAGIVAHPTPELLKLQADLIAAVTPFTVETGHPRPFSPLPMIQSSTPC